MHAGIWYQIYNSERELSLREQRDRNAQLGALGESWRRRGTYLRDCFGRLAHRKSLRRHGSTTAAIHYFIETSKQ